MLFLLQLLPDLPYLPTQSTLCSLFPSLKHRHTHKMKIKTNNKTPVRLKNAKAKQTETKNLHTNMELVLC